MERWLSGRRRTIGNRVNVNSVPWVQIPFSPLKALGGLHSAFLLFWLRTARGLKADLEYWRQFYEDEEDCPPARYDGWLDNWLEALGVCGTVVDLGCGYGVDSVFLAGKGIVPVACDLSERALQALRRRAPQVPVHAFDMAQGLPFDSGALGAVIADLSLHYFDWQTTCCIAKEILRVLRPGGLLLCRVNALEEYRPCQGDIQLEANFYRTQNGGDKRFFSGEDVRRMLEGFRLEELELRTTEKYGALKRCWMAAARKENGAGRMAPERMPR